MLRVLEPKEQIRISIADAGKLYENHFIFFTNVEQDGRRSCANYDYGIPRVISTSHAEFTASNLYKNYDSFTDYGLCYYCSAYIKPKVENNADGNLNVFEHLCPIDLMMLRC